MHASLSGSAVGSLFVFLSSLLTRAHETPSFHTQASESPGAPQSSAWSAKPPPTPMGYDQHNLVSDDVNVNPADHPDPNLVNSWGVAFNPAGAVWVANNGTGVATLYDGLGNPQPAPPQNPLIVTIPPPKNSSSTATPTGIVFDATGGFKVPVDTKQSSSLFIFATEDGTISGWDPSVDFTHAVLAVDNSDKGTVYKGLALLGDGTRFLLFATDFFHATVDVFDTTFAPVTTDGGFEDPNIPDGFAPFGIQAINGNLYVTYAQQNDDKHDDLPGLGRGFVNVFDPHGNLIRRLISQGPLDAPWGLAFAPANFGPFSNHLLVGNFGNGIINAFDLATGHFDGFLESPIGEPIVIDGLWGLQFGNGVLNQPTNTLFFSSGPDGEGHGLYGRIDVHTSAN